MEGGRIAGTKLRLQKVRETTALSAKATGIGIGRIKFLTEF
jgi:hypothetical protein